MVIGQPVFPNFVFFCIQIAIVAVVLVFFIYFYIKIF